MKTVDRRRVRAPAERVYRTAAAVDRWPQILSHYRWVVLEGRDGDAEIVEMAAWRPFGLFKYPTWWRSRMWADPETLTVRYRHIDGVTTGMDVEWQLLPDGGETEVTIVHQWAGPRWPIISRPAADWIIGPLFVSAIASRTLAGLGRYLESRE